MNLSGGDSALIDVHSHAIAPELPLLARRYPFPYWPTVRLTGPEAGSIFVGNKEFRGIDSRCWAPERRLADMNAHGVDVQVISPVPITFCYRAPVDGAKVLARHQNEFLAAMVAAAPERFRALGAVPLQDPEAAEVELRYCIDRLGFIGVEVGTNVAGLDLADPSFAAFLDTATDLGALVFVHPGEICLGERVPGLDMDFGLAMPLETAVAGAALLLSGTFERWPNLRICLAHGGGALPGILARLEHGWRTFPATRRSHQPPLEAARHFFCDSLTYDIDALTLAIRRFGAQHVMVGTDYPFAAQEEPPGAVMSAAGFPAEHLDAVGRTNFMNLFPSEAVTSRFRLEAGPDGTADRPARSER